MKQLREYITEKVVGILSIEKERDVACQVNTRWILAINGNANFMRTSREANVRIRGNPVEQKKEEERKSVSFRVVCPEISVAAHHVTLDAMNSV